MTNIQLHYYGRCDVAGELCHLLSNHSTNLVPRALSLHPSSDKERKLWERGCHSTGSAHFGKSFSRTYTPIHHYILHKNKTYVERP